MADRHKLWGGAFAKEPSPVAWSFGQSIVSDMTLLHEEVRVSQAHAMMLGKASIITDEEAKAICEGLAWVEEHIGDTSDLKDFEDIHAAVEAKLRQKIGGAADKLHAGRSRNDQVATASRLWLADSCKAVGQLMVQLQACLSELAATHLHDPMPGYTHQQTAQPITIGSWFFAYFWMLQRDIARFAAVKELALEYCPLGSGALAGSTLPLDRHFIAAELGFRGPSPSSLDGVSDRDFVCDGLNACAILMQHLSRLSQEIVLFSTSEFGFLRLDDSMSTGSSIMPQKRNPDYAELIRGRSSRTVGNWVAVMGMMRGLPLGYNRDQQDDKPPLFDSISLCQDSLVLTCEMLESATWNFSRLESMAMTRFSTATALAEALVKQNVAFREAHELVGKAVLFCEQSGKQLAELSEDEAASLGLTTDSLRSCSVDGALHDKTTYGSPGRQPLNAQLAEARDTLNLNTLQFM